MTISSYLLIIAIAILTPSGVYASVESTCKAAYSKDRRVNTALCVKELNNDHASPKADAKDLAMVAASLGVHNADKAIVKIRFMASNNKTASGARLALSQCLPPYSRISKAFFDGYQQIGNRSYAAGKEKVGQTVALANECDSVLLKAGLGSPLKQNSVYSVSIAVMCAAIINVIPGTVV